MSKSFHSSKIFTNLIIVFILAACNNPNNEKTKILNVLEENILSSNKYLDIFVTSQLKELEGKSYEPATQERAKIWLPKAELIALFSKIRYDFIEQKKQKEKFTDVDLSEIFKTLDDFKKEVLGRDPELKETFNSEFGFINQYKNLVSEDSNSKNISIKKSLPEKYTRLILTVLQNEIKKIENKIITYCNNKVGSIIDSFESFNTIIGQNTKYLKPGEVLEITAGVGSFCISCKPEFLVNGKKKKMNEAGLLEYKVKAGNKPGKYKLPVEISFFNETTWRQEIHKFFVEYTITSP